MSYNRVRAGSLYRYELLKHSQRIVFAEGDAIAIQLLMRTEMGLAYNASMPGRGI